MWTAILRQILFLDCKSNLETLPKMIVAYPSLSLPYKTGPKQCKWKWKFYHHWKLYSLAYCKEYSIIPAFSPCKFGSWAAGSLNQCSGGHHIMVSVYSATGRSKFFVLTCCDFLWMQSEAAVSVKVQKTQYRMPHRASGRKSKGVLLLANFTLPQCEMSQERSLEHD